MMSTFKTAALAATAAVALLAAPAAAQRNRDTAAPAAPVVVVADTDGAIQASNAYQVAMQQMQATYAPQLAELQTRRTALQAELQTLYTAVETEQNRTPQNRTALETAARNFQARQAAAEQEIQRIGAPLELARSYIIEQITLQMNTAVTTARTARGANMVLRRESVIYANETANITPAIVAELNRLVPNVQIVPPQGYEPGQLIAAQQAAANPAAAAATPAPATPQPETR
jgi:Skp family chaperone for outer membrane proteins